MKERNKSDFTSALHQLNSQLISSCRCILVVGSFAEGLQSSTSDLDLFVIADDYNGPFFNEIASGKYEGRTIEVKLLTSTSIAAALERYRSDSYAPYDPRELEYIHKICTGIPIYGESQASTLKLDFDHQVFCRNMTKYYSNYATDIFMDYVGAVVENDIISSIAFADFMVETAADGWLASRGDTYPKSKWRGRRIMRQSAPSELLSHYRRHVYQCRIDKIEDHSRYILDCFMLLMRLKCATEFGISPNETSCVQQLKLCKPLMISKYPKGYICRTLEKAYAIDSIAAAILLCCYEPRSKESIIEQVNLMFNNTSLSQVTASSVLGRIESLVSLGVISEDI